MRLLSKPEDGWIDVSDEWRSVSESHFVQKRVLAFSVAYDRALASHSPDMSILAHGLLSVEFNAKGLNKVVVQLFSQMKPGEISALTPMALVERRGPCWSIIEKQSAYYSDDAFNSEILGLEQCVDAILDQKELWEGIGSIYDVPDFILYRRHSIHSVLKQLDINVISGLLHSRAQGAKVVTNAYTVALHRKADDTFGVEI